MPQVKQALSIQLPVIKGERVELTLATNERARTSVVTILRVSYNQGYIFITIESKNSIYKDIPVPVNPSRDFIDGQIIEPGQSVTTSFGTTVMVAEITQVTTDGVRITDNTGKEYMGDIKAK